MTIPTLHRPASRAFFFWTGIVATIAYRAIIFFTDADPVILRVIWYIGTVGFVVYFLHRYDIAKRRTRVIRELNLAEKIPPLKELSDADRAGMQYLFATLQSSRERWNYYVIFASSVIALLAGLWMDFVK
ncbi:MAG: hypothetical protein AAB402_05015 [Patescibacteria group bacterium]